MAFLKDLDYITQYQHGLINKRSTQSAMLSIMEFMYENYNNKKTTAGSVFESVQDVRYGESLDHAR